MLKYFVAVSLLLFLSEAAFARNVILVLSGDTEQRHHNIAVKVAESAAKKGNSVVVGAIGKGEAIAGIEWVKPLVSPKDMDNAVKATAQMLQPDDVLTIFITDHGVSGNKKNPLSASISLDGIRNYSHADLLKLINKTVPSQTMIRVIGIHCYSGAIHEISLQRPNTCSAASSTYLEKTYSSTDAQINYYGQNLWKLVGDSPTDLFVAHEYARFRDAYLNKFRGQHSSVYYAQKILRSKKKKVTDISEGGFLTSCACSKDEQFQSTLLTLSENLKKSASDVTLMEKLPDAMKREFEKARAEFDQKRARIEEDGKKIRDQIHQLDDQYRAMGMRARMANYKNLEKQKTDLDNEWIRKVVSLGSGLLIANDFSIISEFWSSASEAEKERFLQLTRCESVNF